VHVLRYALAAMCLQARRAHTVRLAHAQALPVPDLALATFAPEGSGAIIRKWALSPHLLLCSFKHRHVPISGSPDFPLPSYLPQSYNLTRAHRVLLSAPLCF
jgi:hypothetical protein